MKKLMFFVSLIVFTSCGNVGKIDRPYSDGRFAYVLPFKVEEEIWNLIKNKGFQNRDLYFQLRRINDIYHLLITPSIDIDKEYFGYFKVSTSNRRILINDSYYLLVFDHDYELGSWVNQHENLIERKKRFDSDIYEIKRGPYATNALTFGVKFSTAGEILK